MTSTTSTTSKAATVAALPRTMAIAFSALDISGEGFADEFVSDSKNVFHKAVANITLPDGADVKALLSAFEIRVNGVALETGKVFTSDMKTIQQGRRKGEVYGGLLTVEASLPEPVEYLHRYESDRGQMLTGEARPYTTTAKADIRSGREDGEDVQRLHVEVLCKVVPKPGGNGGRKPKNVGSWTITS